MLNYSADVDVEARSFTSVNSLRLKSHRHSISTILTKLAGMMVVPQISTAQYLFIQTSPLARSV
jgi:hypothetical protein